MTNLNNIIGIREIRDGDLDWVIRVGLATPEFKTGTEAAQFYGLETLRRWIKDPCGVTLVAEVNGSRAGFLLGYYMAGPNDGYINCTVVEKGFRRRGVGRLLQEQAVSEFERRGPEGHKCDHIFCVVSEDDRPMLELKRKVGFEVGGKFHYVEMMLPRKVKN
jgi:ribosomal protein S18 acetylase RimI-like enzyme